MKVCPLTQISSLAPEICHNVLLTRIMELPSPETLIPETVVPGDRRPMIHSSPETVVPRDRRPLLTL